MKLCCKKCNEAFGYKTILKSGYKITCPNCGYIYKIEPIYRILISSLIALPLFSRLVLPDNLSFQTYVILFLCSILYIIFILLISPFFINNLRFPVFLIIAAILSLCIYYSWPRNININYDGVKYQAGNQNTCENVKINVEGKLRKKLFSGEAEFNGKIIADGINLDYSNYPLTFTNKGLGVLDSIKSGNFITYGSIIISNTFDNMTIMIYKNGEWSSEDGWLISAPCSNREEAAAMSDLLFKRQHPDVNIK